MESLLHGILIIADLFLLVFYCGITKIRRRMRNDSYELFYKTCFLNGRLKGIRDAIDGIPLDAGNIKVPPYDNL